MSAVYVLALKQTQAVDPQIKAETQAEASTDSPEPVSIEVVQSRCAGVQVYARTTSSLVLDLDLGRDSRHFASLGLTKLFGLSVRFGLFSQLLTSLFFFKSKLRAKCVLENIKICKSWKYVCPRLSVCESGLVFHPNNHGVWLLVTWLRPGKVHFLLGVHCVVCVTAWWKFYSIFAHTQVRLKVQWWHFKTQQLTLSHYLPSPVSVRALDPS